MNLGKKSESGIDSFIGKDINADSFFDEYLYFIEKESTKLVIEIFKK